MRSSSNNCKSPSIGSIAWMRELHFFLQDSSWSSAMFWKQPPTCWRWCQFSRTLKLIENNADQETSSNGWFEFNFSTNIVLVLSNSIIFNFPLSKQTSKFEIHRLLGIHVVVYCTVVDFHQGKWLINFFYKRILLLWKPSVRTGYWKVVDLC